MKFSFSEKNRKITTYVLYLFSLLLVYLIYSAIDSPIEFNKIKNERYLKVIDRLKDIRNAQIAYKSVNGIYSDNFDSLISFIDSAQFTIIEKRDSSYMQYDRVYRIDMLREVIVIDTLGFVSVRDYLILYDQNKDLITQEKEIVSVDGVNGPFLILGSMSDVSTNGNWPTTFDVETK